MKKITGSIILILFLLLPVGLKGQKYRMELGLAGGISSYMGDANSDKPLLNPNAAFGLTSRLNLSGNTALRGNLGLAGISGSTFDRIGNFMNGRAIEFKQTLIDANVLFELAFFQYGVPQYQPGFSLWSPYVTLGIGVTDYRSDRNRLSLNIPFGIGVKYKVKPRINIGCEWIFRKTFTDDLDYNSSLTGFQLNNNWSGSTDLNKNKDWFSVLELYITLDLWGTSPVCYR